MPSVVGNRKSSNVMGNGYKKDSIYNFAKAFNECVTNVLNESGVDLYAEPMKAMRYESVYNALKNFFVEGTEDNAAIAALAGDEDADEAIEDAEEALEEQFLNDREAVLEYANIGTMNPVIGMTFPLHKNILMNNIFDKGAIPKVVAREPKFTITMENRYLVTKEGEKIDIYKEQYRIFDAIESVSPFKEHYMVLPEQGTTNMFPEATHETYEHIDIDAHINAIKVNVYCLHGQPHPITGVEVEGDTDKWDTNWAADPAIVGDAAGYKVPTNMSFVPAYGEYDRTITMGFNYKTYGWDPTAGTAGTGAYVLMDMNCVLSGFTKDDKFYITEITGSKIPYKDTDDSVKYKDCIIGVQMAARVDTSSAMVETPSVCWDTRTTVVEIPSANPINTPISPEEIKDIAALYNTNQLAKIMSMIKLVLGNYKDDKILRHLDSSFVTMPKSQKFTSAFDFVPERAGYAFSSLQWRKEMFADFLDGFTTSMLQVLNDPNMTVSVFGSPELIRKITPTEYTYQTPNNIGPVELDFTRTIVTSDKRVYQFIGSDKLRGFPYFILILCPRNSERIIYRIYDYQMYISNEIRNVKNYALPAIHAFERWKFVEYQPVQGRIRILHPSGLSVKPDNGNPLELMDRNYNYNEYTDARLLYMHATPGSPIPDLIRG